MQETQAAVKGRAAPALYRGVSDLIHRIDDGKHFFNGHSGGDQRLTGITQNGFHDLYFCHFSSP